MATAPKTRTPKTAFPTTVVSDALREAITRLGEITSAIREPWEPTFDSLAVVEVLVVIESVLPNLKIAPEKVVRKGGYMTVEEATNDITLRLQHEWERTNR